MEGGTAGDPAGEEKAVMAARTSLLHDLVRWREMLARSIARNNLALRSDGIALSVNRILFPLLLLRIAEDRHLVPEGTLAALCNTGDPVQIILELAPFADVLYIDSLHSEPVSGSHRSAPVVENRVLVGVLEALCSPGRRYDFRGVSTSDIADVLMLYNARTVRRSAAHMATVVDTHDTVMSGGTVIPPQTLARYLVKGAVASVLKDRSAGEILPVRILDPACGSGALLLVAFRQMPGAGPSVPFEERREVLLHSVYGLDKSPHAVAATRLVLLLGLFENPPTGRSFEYFQASVLSVLNDLRHTIRCGNALIGPEIVSDESWIFCPVRDRHNLNIFSYMDDFTEILASGGFELIISNPPEGALEKREWIQQYFQRKYRVYHPLADRSAYFLEKALTLAAPGGVVAMCMSSRWLRGAAGSPLRAQLSRRRIEEIVDLSAIPAEEPGAGLSLIRIYASRPATQITVIAAGHAFVRNPDAEAEHCRFPVMQETLGTRGWVLADTRADLILEKATGHGTPLGEFVMGQVHDGVRISPKDPFLISSRQADEWLRLDQRCRPLLHPVLTAADIGRYSTRPAEKFLLIIPLGWTLSHKGAGKNPWQWLKRRHPQIARHLKARADVLKASSAPKELWWESDTHEFWQERKSRIMFPVRGTVTAFCFDTGRAVGDETVMAIPSAGRYLAGILNSRLMRFVISRTAADKPELTWDDLAGLPVYMPDLDEPEDRARHDRMERLVKKKMDLERQYPIATAAPERGALVKKIQAAEKQIDVLVYNLYNLTTEEIAVVEEMTGR